MPFLFFLLLKAVNILKEKATLDNWEGPDVCQPDYPEVGSQPQSVPDQLHHLQGLLDNNSKQNMTDLFIYYKSLVVLCMYKGSKLGIIIKFMLDWTTCTEYKLEIKMVTSLSREMLQSLLSFSPSTWVPQILLFFSSTFQWSLQQVFILGAAEWFDIAAFLPWVQHLRLVTGND